MINNKAIRAYDIRGVYGQTLFADDAFLLGFAFASYLRNNNKANNVIVAYDGRLSSPFLYTKLCQGLLAADVDVYSLGLATTPYLYFATNQPGYPQAGIMITASHNPKEYNGFKIVVDGISITPEQLQEIVSTMISLSSVKVAYEQPQKVRKLNLQYDYTMTLAAEVKNHNQLKVIWDAGNGAAGVILQKLLPHLPGKHILLNDVVDGNFPIHHPDPTIPSNLDCLIAEVQNKNADFGLAFDGDGDRLGAVTNKGEILFGDHLLAIMGADCLSRNRNAKIIADVKTSAAVLSYLTRLGGEVILYKCGHAFIKHKIRQSKALIAGEMSGHLFFSENYLGFDDAIFAACKLLNIVAGQGVEVLNNALKLTNGRYITPEIRLLCQDKNKFLIIDRAKDLLAQQKIAYNDIDGIRMENEHGWWLMRASNTEEVIILRFDADTEKSFQKQKKMAEELLGVNIYQ